MIAPGISNSGCNTQTANLGSVASGIAISIFEQADAYI